MKSLFNQKINIGNKQIGAGKSVFIVAEAGVAHFGKISKAIELVDMAIAAKADAIKFQIFDTEELVSLSSIEWKKRLKSRELPYVKFKEIAEYCKEKGIIFFATAHDVKSLDYLVTLDPLVYKIGSGEVGNWEFIQNTLSLGKPVFVSTGMYDWNAIHKLIKCIEKSRNRNVVLLHCVTSYPTPVSEVNLKTIHELKEKVGCIVGYSDHTEGWHIPLAAVVLGAKIIEKHISLDFNVKNAQDWKVSCGPNNLKLMIDQIRQVEKCIGKQEIKIAECEKSSKYWACKSIVSLRDIAAGTVLKDDMITMRRPGTGIPVEMVSKVLGKRVVNNIQQNTVIAWDDLE